MAPLFKEFDEISAKQWKQKIQMDLKGADYNKTLVWESLEGISVKPFYHKDALKQLPISTAKKNYSICRQININDENDARQNALKALEDGANALLFAADKPFDAKVLIKDLPKGLDGKKVALHFNLSFLEDGFFSKLATLSADFDCTLNIDIIGNLAAIGNWFYDKNKDHKLVENIINKSDQSTKILGVNAALYQNAGANIVQQVAYALGHGNAYLDAFKTNAIQFRFAVGSNYFFEIAKLRAFRYLWNLLLAEYDLAPECQLFVTPSTRNKTVLDPYVNMLRTTSECMSAVLGGADTIANLPYDVFFDKNHDFGQRIAKNQLLILQEESGLNPGNNFADGSYYIAALTTQIAEKSLELFNLMENHGGFVKQLLSGTVQRKIGESAAKEQQLFDDKELVLVGANKYQNATEKGETTSSDKPVLGKRNSRKTRIEPVIPKRLSEKEERKVLKNRSL